MSEKGDIIQITDEKHAWFPALLIVSEVKLWGVQAFTMIPHSNAEQDVRRAYIRLKTNEFEKVGSAAFIPETEF